MPGDRHAVDVLAQFYPDAIRGSLIEIVGDSQCASYIFANGGSQVVDEESGLLLLTDTLIATLDTAARGGFAVRFRWVKREFVQDADDLSKFADRMDFSLSDPWFKHVSDKYGTCDIDRFAAAHNTKCARFNSMFGTVGTENADASALRTILELGPELHSARLQRRGQDPRPHRAVERDRHAHRPRMVGRAMVAPRAVGSLVPTHPAT